MPLRVAYILDRFPQPSETFILNEIVSVMRHGHDCRIFSAYRPYAPPLHAAARALVDGGRVKYLPSAGCVRRGCWLLGRLAGRPRGTYARLRALEGQGHLRWYATGALSLTRDVERYRADVLHAHFAAVGAQYAAGVHHWTGIPMTITAHRYDIFDLPPDNYPQLASMAAALVTISQYNRRYLVDHFGVADEKIRVIHCGVETDVFAPPEKPRGGGGRCDILCVATLVPVKGHRYLLDAVSELRRSGVDCTLTLAGDGLERADLERRAAERGLGSAVRFLGFQTQDQVRDLMRVCDMVVLPSLSEGIPVCLMEAMSCEAPVVATSVCGVPELVTDRVTGLLVPPADAKAIAAAIRWVATHPVEAQAMGRRARQQVAAQFDLSACTKQLIDLWQGACGA